LPLAKFHLYNLPGNFFHPRAAYTCPPIPPWAIEPKQISARINLRTFMRFSRPFRGLFVGLAFYLDLCAAASIVLADGTFHPARRPLTPEAETGMQEISRALGSDLEAASVPATDGVTSAPGRSIRIRTTATR